MIAQTVEIKSQFSIHSASVPDGGEGTFLYIALDPSGVSVPKKIKFSFSSTNAILSSVSGLLKDIYCIHAVD